MLQIVRIGPDQRDRLTSFFRELAFSSVNATFSPHPFTPEEAVRISGALGKDLYFAAIDASAMVAYGMLRGWDEGYAIPSLGVCVHPDFTGQGIGELMTRHLIEAAREAGALQVMLKVNRDNAPAKRLYEKLGFALREHDATYLKGTLELK